MVEVAVESGVGMIGIPAEMELSTILNCYKVKWGSLERGNYGTLKLKKSYWEVYKLKDGNL